MSRARSVLGLLLLPIVCVVFSACTRTIAASPTPGPTEPAPGQVSSTVAAERDQPVPATDPEDASRRDNATTDRPAAKPEEAESVALQPLPKGTRVLQIGDSFADALGGKLSRLFRAAEVKSDLEFETPSYIPNWSYGSKLPKLLAAYHPDLVLITLGANEVEIPHPEDRAKPVKHLVATLAGRPCVWIAPPLWKPDSGVLAVIRDNVSPCRYLDSNLFIHDLPRGRDKIHPSLEGREIWAKVVFDWLVRERVGAPSRPWAFKPEFDAGTASVDGAKPRQ